MGSNRLPVIVTASVCALGVAHASQTINYTYDPLGRLTNVQSQNSSGSGATQAFIFDAAGNRTNYQVMIQVALSMSSAVVNLTPSGGRIALSVSDPSATGTVTFLENGTVLGSGSVSNGQVSALLQGLAKGAQTITVSYSGDATHSAQTTTFTVNVQNLSWLPAVLQLLLQN